MPRKPHSHHYIYKTTCNVTGRFYVGMHSTSNLEDGYLGSGKRLRSSIRKYGIENHSKEILEFLPDRSSLKEREKNLVNEDLLHDPLCMNLQPGGGGGFSSEEHKKKCSSAGGNKTAFNRKHDADLDNLFKLKASESAKNAWKNEEYRNTISKANIGEKNPFYGKEHSEEFKNRMKGHKRQSGEANSQFGTCWIYNNHLKKCTKIKRCELNDYINEGWIKGMKKDFLK